MRCDPEMVKRLYSNVDQTAGGPVQSASCDTAGHATPVGAMSLVRFVVEESRETVGRKNPRRLARPQRPRSRIANSHGGAARRRRIAFTAAPIVHAARARSATRRLDQMLVTSSLMGLPPGPAGLTQLKQYCSAVSRATGVPIPANYPVVAKTPFRTATGRPCRRVIKAFKKMIWNWPTRSYSGVPSACFRHGAGDRHRPMKRQIKCAVLAGAARHCAHRQWWSSASCKKQKPATTHSQRQKFSSVARRICWKTNSLPTLKHPILGAGGVGGLIGATARNFG